MDYNETIKKIDAFIGENMDILQLLYPRKFDCEYSLLIKDVKAGHNLEQRKKEIEYFFKFRGMNDDAIINLLKLFDSEKKEIQNEENDKDASKLYKLYCDLLDKIEKITGNYQYVNTSKLMNLYNQNIPLFDNNVINFLNHIEVDINNRTKETYCHIVNIYKLINEKTNIPNIIQLKNNVYSNMEIKYINLNKFVDTLMYFINDAEKLSEYKKLCLKK